MSPLGRSALAYARRFGWPVFPLKARDKVPNGSLVPNGVLQATTDLPTITAWWSKAPSANIGIATGHGFFVVDIDPRNQGDDTLVQLEQRHGELPETVRGLTGGGGQHILFALPPDAPKLKGTLGEGIDIKGKGGYIVAPPSIHPSGPEYRWDAGAHPTDTAIAPPPGWLMAALAKRDVTRDPSKVLGSASQSFLARCFDIAGWLGNEVDSLRVMARCPWVHEHSVDKSGERTGGGQDTSTVLFAATPEHPLGRFFCAHGHCRDKRGTTEALRAIPTPAVRCVALEYRELAETAIRLLLKWKGNS